MLTTSGPCLVEMNCRAHGANGAFVPLAKALTGGYSQVDATVDAFVDADAFERIPNVPTSPFKASGQVVLLVSMAGGRVVATPGIDRIRHLASFVSLESSKVAGSYVVP